MRKEYAIRKVKRNTKEEILAACIDLFSENGFSAVSIRDITGIAGINESSLYNHYKGKYEIMDRIIDKFRLEFGKAFSGDASEIESQLVGTEPEVFLQHHVLNLRDRMTPEVQKIWKILYMEIFRDKRVRDFFVKEALKVSSAYYERVFQVMADKGLIKPMDPKVLADEYNFAFMGLQIENMLLKTDGEDITDNARRIFAHVRFICDAARK